MSYITAVQQAATDPLTGLANRRAFFADINAEIARQKRYGGSFSLAVLDLDGFKALNDTKGHRAGDEALKVVADVLRTRTRKSDSLGRIGGDEFGILMPNAQGADCTRILRDLAELIAARTAAVDCAVTASIGCKTFLWPPENSGEALQQTDKIMYEAKLRGRNRTGRDGRSRVDSAADSAARDCAASRHRPLEDAVLVDPQVLQRSADMTGD